MRNQPGVSVGCCQQTPSPQRVLHPAAPPTHTQRRTSAARAVPPPLLGRLGLVGQAQRSRGGSSGLACVGALVSPRCADAAEKTALGLAVRAAHGCAGVCPGGPSPALLASPDFRLQRPLPSLPQRSWGVGESGLREHSQLQHPLAPSKFLFRGRETFSKSEGRKILPVSGPVIAHYLKYCRHGDCGWKTLETGSLWEAGNFGCPKTSS